MRLRLLAALTALVASSWASAAPALTITLPIARIVSAASNDGGAGAFVQSTPTSVPTARTLTATDFPIISTSTTTYSLSTASFDITFDHRRGPAYLSYATSEAEISFIPDVDVDFVMSGVYSSADPDGRVVRLSAELYDATDPSQVYFYSEQESNATPDESLTLGQSGGDYFNVSAGSPTGQLIGGHEYYFFVAATIYSWPTSGTNYAHAGGSVTLSFVPEPSTATLLGAGLAGIAAARRRSLIH